MENFNLGSVDEWRPWAGGQMLDLDVGVAGYRKVEIEIIADAFVSVRLVQEDEVRLLGCGSGLLTFSFGIDIASGLLVVADEDTLISIRTRTEPLIVPESLEASYTDIEPRVAGPSDEMRRLMHLVRINSERRERALIEESRAREDRLVAELAKANAGKKPADDAVIEPVEDPAKEEEKPNA